MAEKSVGDVLQALADDRLDEERKIKESLAARSSIVIVSSGVLVTLLLGVATVLAQAHSFKVPLGALICVTLGLVLLIVAMVLALVVNAPWQQESIKLEPVEHDPSLSDWNSSDDQLTIQAYRLRLQLIDSMRVRNGSRARYLTMALAAECVCFIALSAAGVWILVIRR